VTFPHEELAAHPHDRVGTRRTDEAWLAERWSDPGSRVLVLAGTRVRPREDGLDWRTTAEAPEGIRILLGEHGGRTSWAVVVDPADVADRHDEWLPLRGVLPFLPAVPRGDAPLLLHAVGLAEWLWATRHCPRCGGGLLPEAAGHELRCTRCGRRQYPRTDPAVIMIVTAGEPGSADERCLLGRQPTWPTGRYSTLAGFCEPGETAEDAVRREVLEETSVVVDEVSYVGSQGWPLPGSLMLGYRGRAVTDVISLEDEELEDARWFTRAEMRRRAEEGSLVLPTGVSISRSLVEGWYGEPLPGSW
jgi:NAD+ diphosphatase